MSRRTLDLYVKAQAEVSVRFVMDMVTGEFREVSFAVTAQELSETPRGHGSFCFIYPGGEIAVSPNVTRRFSESDIINWIRQKAATIINRVKRDSYVMDVVKKTFKDQCLPEIGFTVRRTGRGRYISPGVESDEKSFEVVVKGVPYDVLAALGRGLGEQFQQSAVLLTDYSAMQSEMLHI